jgi:ABC-2 type transport system permease protein
MIVIASLLMVGGIMYFQYTMQASLVGEIPMEDIINNRIDLIWLLGSFFPPSIWATRAIADAGSLTGFANLLYLIIASAVAFGSFMAVGQRVFYGGLVGGAERDRKGQMITAHVLEKKAVQRSPLRALYTREWNLFLRVPIWVMNGFLAVVIIPLMLFFPASTAGRSIPELAAMVHFANNGLLLSALATAAIIGLLGSLNTLASTSVSREGRHLWISRSLPVPATYQVTAKLAHAGIGALVAAVPVAMVYAIVITPGTEYVLAALILGLVFSATPQILGLLFDMWRPLLTWTNPQHAVKNNLNAVLPMIIAGATGFTSYLLVLRVLLPAGMGEWVVILGVLTLQLILAAVSLTITLRAAPGLYNQMEDK